jgi:hypothetical protein
MVILIEGDASSSVGVALALLVNFLSDSVNDVPALPILGLREDCGVGVSKGSTLCGGDFFSEGDIDNKPCNHLSASELQSTYAS